jgi:hypothetical protein
MADDTINGGQLMTPVGAAYQQIISNSPPQSFPDTSLRGKVASKKAQQQPLVFPSDLKAGTGNYPNLTITIVEYPVNNSALIKDITGSSAVCTPSNPTGSQTNLIISDALNANKYANQSNGVNPVKGKTVSTIVLPIPQHVQNSLHMNWEIADFAAGRAILQAAKTIGGNLENTFKNGGSLFDANWGSTLAAGETAVGGLAAVAFSPLLQRTVNIIANPKKQAFFNGVEPRAFQFDWVLTPTTQAEAQMIASIISTMTKYALPELIADSLFFNFPMEFEVTFNGVQGFPEIDTMVLTDLSTNYTPNMLQLLTTGHSVQVILSCAFIETTLKTQQRPGIMPATQGVNPTTAQKASSPSVLSTLKNLI